MAPEWQILKSKAVWHRQRGDIEAALVAMKSAVESAVSTDVAEDRLGSMYNYVADLHLENDDYDNAEVATRNAISLSESELNIAYADNLLMLADVFIKKKDYAIAQETVHQAIKVLEMNNHMHGVGRAHQKLDSIAHFKTG